MKIIETLINKEHSIVTSIEKHANLIKQLEEAIIHHLEAKKYLKIWNNYEVYINTIQAKGHIEHALSEQKEILKENTINR